MLPPEPTITLCQVAVHHVHPVVVPNERGVEEVWLGACLRSHVEVVKFADSPTAP